MSLRRRGAGVFVEALAVGAIALLIFGPLCGIVLDGFAFKTHWHRPLALALVVFLGRLVMNALTAAGVRAPSLPLAAAGDWIAGPAKVGLIAVAVGAAFAMPWLTDKYWLGVLILALIYVLLGLGLNIVVGLAGLLDLGFVGFYAVGAYTYALGADYLGIGFWVALPMAAVLAAICGAILGFPVLRMHGDYLAIVTLGFGEIIRLVLNNWLEFTGGPNGVRAPVPTLFGLEFTRSPRQGGVPFHEFFGLEYTSHYRYIFIYLVLLVVVLGVIAAVTRLRRMPLGRAWEALREDEIACRALGINHVNIKLAAFSFGAMIAGLAGCFFAAHQGLVSPMSFTFFESALILAVVVLGGLGSTVGVILAALLMTILPELLREFATYRILIFGAVMVLMMVWRPRGLIRMRRPNFLRPRAGSV